MKKVNSSAALFWILSTSLVGVTSATAQNITVQGQPISVCADSDCRVVFDPGSEAAVATAYFAAKTFAATNATNALMNQQISLLNNLIQAQNATNLLITSQIDTFNQDLRSAINARFDSLPAELMTSDAIKQLKADILTQVDAKLKTLNPAAAPPPVAPVPAPAPPLPAPPAAVSKPPDLKPMSASSSPTLAPASLQQPQTSVLAQR